MKNFFIELYLRVKLAAPDFFVKLRKVLFSISAICAILLESGVDFEVFGISFTKVSALATAGAALITFLIVKDNDALNKALLKQTK